MSKGRHRYRRRNEFPGIVIYSMGYWMRIFYPPYGMEVIK